MDKFDTFVYRLYNGLPFFRRIVEKVKSNNIKDAEEQGFIVCNAERVYIHARMEAMWYYGLTLVIGGLIILTLLL